MEASLTMTRSDNSEIFSTKYFHTPMTFYTVWLEPLNRMYAGFALVRQDFDMFNWRKIANEGTLLQTGTDLFLSQTFR